MPDNRVGRRHVINSFRKDIRIQPGNFRLTVRDPNCAQFGSTVQARPQDDVAATRQIGSVSEDGAGAAQCPGGAAFGGTSKIPEPENADAARLFCNPAQLLQREQGSKQELFCRVVLLNLKTAPDRNFLGAFFALC
ncbi:MAG: hypothetical protein JSR41_23360 [Proteobacteria bacterium]|nr:hypothetical protein [Pseudomonadota bacterium]